MFVERLKRLNPSLVTDAMQLHQADDLRANTYLLDTATMTANTRLIRAEADRLGLHLYAMAKQFGRNRDACDAIVDGGIETCVAVDIQWMQAVQRSRMRIGHVGHLVQPHRGTEVAVIAARPEVVSVFHEDVAKRLGVAAQRASVEQGVLLRVVGPGDHFYFGHGGGLGPSVLLLDDPTAGIDIGSRRDLLAHVRRFADDGGAVMVVSSELEDLGYIADRVVILNHGAISQILDRAAGDVPSEANLLAAIHGGNEAAA